jgi:hypothetical protein
MVEHRRRGVEVVFRDRGKDQLGLYRLLWAQKEEVEQVTGRRRYPVSAV